MFLFFQSNSLQIKEVTQSENMLVVKEEMSESGETEEITVKEELYEANKNYVINEKPEEICKPNRSGYY